MMAAQRGRYDSVDCRRPFASHLRIEVRNSCNRVFRNQPNFSKLRIIHPDQNHVGGCAVHRKYAGTYFAGWESSFNRTVGIIAQQVDVAIERMAQGVNLPGPLYQVDILPWNRLQKKRGG